MTIRACQRADAAAALAIIAQAWPEVERQTHLAALWTALAGGNGQSAIVLSADREGESLAAVAAQILPGRVASVTPPQIETGRDASDESIAQRLLDRLNDDLSRAGLELAQALLPADDESGARAMRAAGYEHAADLLYLAAEADSFPEHPPPLPFELLAAADHNPSDLVDLVDATYVGTLDCPRIDNLRKTADVIAGYKAVGGSGNQLWKVVLGENNRRVGCLLIADHPPARQWEIVYVGLIPDVRGRGWGLELTRHAQWLARQANVQRLVLAVDAANEPAIRMYAASGFRAWDRRAIWIKPLARGENVSAPTT